MRVNLFNFTTVVSLVFSFNLLADSIIRWTAKEDTNPSIDHVLAILSQKSGVKLDRKDFLLQDNRKMAFSNYQRYDQTFEDIPIQGKSIRIWSDPVSKKTIQVEAYLQGVDAIIAANSYLSKMGEKSVLASFSSNSRKMLEAAQAVLKRTPSDMITNSLNYIDQWDNGKLYRFYTLKAKRGTHHVKVSLASARVVNYKYIEFPKYDLAGVDTDLKVKAKIYPIYEEMENNRTIFEREDRFLKYIKAQIPLTEKDPFAALKTRNYLMELQSDIMSEMGFSSKMGYWSMFKVKDQANAILKALPETANSFDNGVVLNGRYARITLHPDAVEKYKKDLEFEPRYADFLYPVWKLARGIEMVPAAAYYGKPFYSQDDIYNRVARRLDNHDVLTYMNDGFDEVQVYYAINTLFESLVPRGFNDPELSTRPFTAVLYDPDIGSRDNAYYTDDKINFTTYSSTSQNLARDNTTIWHELGHGVMDRIMGTKLGLGDVGGLSEGMADFIAQLVIMAETKGKRFLGDDTLRIVNNTHFDMTNEIHDDGEAYGGMLKDILDQSIATFGFDAGLNKVSDLVLEAMRLTRDHPTLTAKIWTEHLLFADSLGRLGVRNPYELKNIILKVIQVRNLRLDEKESAKFHLINTEVNQEVIYAANGTRNNPIDVGRLGKKTKTFKVKIALNDSDTFKFNFPITLRVQYQGGPLQGPVHFKGEEVKVQTYTLKSLKEASIEIPITVTGTCDYINNSDDSCSDYVYFQILNEQDGRGVIAKKRFYVSVQN